MTVDGDNRIIPEAVASGTMDSMSHRDLHSGWAFSLPNPDV